MSAPRSHLSFLLGGRRHAIPMDCIRELVYVPLLQPTERVPGHILGFFNLRGEPIPVLDLATLLGFAGRSVHIDDILLVFQPPTGVGSFGLLVEAVEDLIQFQPDELKPPMDDPEAASCSPLVVWLGLKQERLYHLLDLDLVVEAAQAGRGQSRFDVLFTGLDPDVQDKLQARAEAAVEQRSDEGSTGHACLEMRLGGERFAISLLRILHIAHCPPIYPVPGAPPAILGLVNHAGDPMLVVDLRPLLGMPKGPLMPEARLLVVEDGPGHLGIYADEVGEILGVDLADLHAHPAQVASSLVLGEWLQAGFAFHVLDLPAVLVHPDLTLSPNPS